MEKADILLQVCQELQQDNLDMAKQIINEKYPFEKIKRNHRGYSKVRMLQIFIRDGFIDRYSGDRIVFPGTLRILSELMPKEFPYQNEFSFGRTRMEIVSRRGFP
jgi:hypothetical protein